MHVLEEVFGRRSTTIRSGDCLDRKRGKAVILYSTCDAPMPRDMNPTRACICGRMDARRMATAAGGPAPGPSSSGSLR